MNQPNTVLEQISALADGEVKGDEFAFLVSRLGADVELRATWQSYHLLGDVLRAGAHTPCTDSTRFLARLQQSLALEPVFAREPAPVRLAVPMPLPAPTPSETHAPGRVEAANEPVFRWKLVAGAASLAAAAAIGWNWVGVNTAPAGAQLALQQTQNVPVVAVASMRPASAATPSALSATSVMVANGNPQVMLRDPRLDELLEAHRQAGGASQMPSGFLRNATFAAPSR